MTKFIPGSINDRLARNVYDIDEGNPPHRYPPRTRASDGRGEDTRQRVPSSRVFRRKRRGHGGICRLPRMWHVFSGRPAGHADVALPCRLDGDCLSRRINAHGLTREKWLGRFDVCPAASLSEAAYGVLKPGPARLYPPGRRSARQARLAVGRTGADIKHEYNLHQARI